MKSQQANDSPADFSVFLFTAIEPGITNFFIKNTPLLRFYVTVPMAILFSLLPCRNKLLHQLTFPCFQHDKLREHKAVCHKNNCGSAAACCLDFFPLCPYFKNP